ncbi:hypothetical protein PhCBS80983_g00618 [Powellomyces hirtus]|uniref:WLM domain-containing protein n=1 Tax=Powellomyces hirtus TaxID=109895 RepID=A0A507EFR8_9FUNG|nr:hypothetical protein PhCBS80983_g00618 [Powellomyces hirtus]
MRFNEYIETVSALKRYSNHTQALLIIQWVATQVKPIMRARGWKVPMVREFFPSDPRLLGLNINRGREIRIRLRPAHNPQSFYELDDLLGTMLHELTHIVRAPHDDMFYKILGELEKEYDALLAGGWKGEGFFAPGQRVGVGVSHNLPPHQARQKALEAATKRSVMNGTMLPAGGRRLGGVTGLHKVGKTPAQLAAEAAERRAKDNVWCAGHGEKDVIVIEDGDVEMVDAKPESSSISLRPAGSRPGSLSNPILIVDDDGPPPLAASSSSTSSSPSNTTSSTSAPPSSSRLPANSLGKRKIKGESTTSTAPPSTSTPSVVSTPSTSGATSLGKRKIKDEATTSTALAPLPSPSRPPSQPSSSSSSSSPTEWACPTCTCLNRPLALQCDACLSLRPPSPRPQIKRPQSPNAIGEDVWHCPTFL